MAFEHPGHRQETAGRFRLPCIPSPWFLHLCVSFIVFHEKSKKVILEKAGTEKKDRRALFCIQYPVSRIQKAGQDLGSKTPGRRKSN